MRSIIAVVLGIFVLSAVVAAVPHEATAMGSGWTKGKTAGCSKGKKLNAGGACV
jgi:hypothetical protein